MSITIDGHNLPDQLSTLVRKGKWRAPTERKLWASLVSLDQVIQPSLYPLDKANGTSLWESEAGIDFIGVDDNAIIPGKLDPSQSIIIGDLGPERLLALDLRISKSNPPVCAFLPREDDESCWVEIASSLDVFIVALALDS